MKHIRQLLFTTAFLLASIAAFAQKTGLDAKKLDKYFSKMSKDWEVPAVSIGIVKDGELVFTGNYGLRDLEKKDKPDANTLYAVASNSKAFTTAIIGMLVQEGKLGWDDKVQEYLPYFELYDPWVSAHVTVRDLLSHRVGLGTFSGDVIWYKANLTSEEIIKRIKYVPQAYDFRAGYGYSNLMFITAGELIKKVTGKTWAQNVQERILGPLDMNRSITTIDNLDEKGNYVTPYTYREGENIPIEWADWTEVGATGGLISSVEDMAKWVVFNLNNGIHNGDALLTPATRNMVWTPHTNFQIDHTVPNDYGRHFRSYGLGWFLGDYHGRMMVNHTGGYDGIITAVTLIPDEDLGVIVLTNSGKSPIMAATYYALEQMMGINSGKDWSADMLKSREEAYARDTRVADMKASRVMDTQPSVALEKCLGTYQSDIYGKFFVKKEGDKVKLEFEHSPDLSATLTHWHYDVWQIHWDKTQAWFDFGTVQFKTDNHLNVTGLHFDVPNYDFFFEEFKPYKVGE